MNACYRLSVLDQSIAAGSAAAGAIANTLDPARHRSYELVAAEYGLAMLDRAA